MKKIIFGLIVLTITSCASRKDIVYYNDIENVVSTENVFNTTLQRDDLLMILVSAQDATAAQPFNLMSNLSVSPTNQAGGGQYQQQLYLVDSQGNIEFPVLGTIQAAGKTKNELVVELKSKISKYVINPIVNVRIMNYQIAVQGEVNRPDVFRIDSERISLPEALSRAGDLTIYGKRDNVLIIREHNGQRVTHRVDLTSSEFVNSEFYYLKQNDVVYVEPNKVKVNSAAIGPNISVAISVVSLLITILALTIK
jgi:polysaccharide biosynthesis/export protein